MGKENLQAGEKPPEQGDTAELRRAVGDHKSGGITSVHQPKRGMDDETMGPLLCPCCRKRMRLVRTIEHLGSLPELSVFYCAECQQVETRWQGREQRKAA